MFQNTHFDESMKYITRAPILRAKTKTTYKRKVGVIINSVKVKHFFFYTHTKKKNNHKTIKQYSISSVIFFIKVVTH